MKLSLFCAHAHSSSSSSAGRIQNKQRVPHWASNKKTHTYPTTAGVCCKAESYGLMFSWIVFYPLSGGGGLHGKNYLDPIDRLTVPRRIFFFHEEKIGRFRFVLVTTCFSSRFRLVLDQQDTERPVLGSPAEGMCTIARHWPQFVDIVGRRPLSGMRCGLITLGATRNGKATPKIVNTETYFGSRVQAVCNRNWTRCCVSGTRAEGMSMTTRHSL